VSDEMKGSGQFQISGTGTFRGVAFLLAGAAIVGAIWLFSGSDANRKIKVSFEYEESRPEKFKQPQHEKPIEVIPDEKKKEKPAAPTTENKPKMLNPPRTPFYYEAPPAMSFEEQKRFKRLCPVGFDMPEVCYMPRQNRLNIPVHPAR